MTKTETTPDGPDPGPISVGDITDSQGVAIGPGARAEVNFHGLDGRQVALVCGLALAGALAWLGVEFLAAHLWVRFTAGGERVARAIADLLDNQRLGWETATLASAAVSVVLGLGGYAWFARPRPARAGAAYRFEARSLTWAQFALLSAGLALAWLPLVTAGRLPPPTAGDKTHIVVIIDASARMLAPYEDQASKWAVAYGAAQYFLSKQRGTDYSYSLIVVGGAVGARASACADPSAPAVPTSRRNLDAVVGHLGGLAPANTGSLSAAFELARTTLGNLPDDYLKSVFMVIGGPDECLPEMAGDPWLGMIEDLDRIFGPAAVNIQLDTVALVSPAVRQELVTRFKARFPGLRAVTSVAEAATAVDQINSLLTERYRQFAPEDFATEAPTQTAAAKTAQVVLNTAVARRPVTATLAPSTAVVSNSPLPSAGDGVPPQTEAAQVPPAVDSVPAAPPTPTPTPTTRAATWTPVPPPSATATAPPAPTDTPPPPPSATVTLVPPSPTATLPPPPTWTPAPTATETATLVPEVLIIHSPANGANLGCQAGAQCQVTVDVQWVPEGQTFGRTLSIWVLPYPGTPGYKYYVQGDAQYDAGSGHWRSSATIGDGLTPAGAPFRIFAYVTVQGYSGEYDGPPPDASMAASVDVNR